MKGWHLSYRDRLTESDSCILAVDLYVAPPWEHFKGLWRACMLAAADILLRGSWISQVWSWVIPSYFPAVEPPLIQWQLLMIQGVEDRAGCCLCCVVAKCTLPNLKQTSCCCVNQSRLKRTEDTVQACSIAWERMTESNGLEELLAGTALNAYTQFLVHMLSVIK